MKTKVVCDSSCDIYNMEDIDFSAVPLHIINSSKEYIDNEDLDADKMAKELSESGGKTSTSCPGIGDWLNAFDDAEQIFVVTITGALSGSYNSAVQAAAQYTEKFPERKVCVIDSKSTGPVLVLILEKLRELIMSGASFEETKQKIHKYHDKLHLLFVLSSVQNLANNGRVNKLAAAAIGLLGVCLMGQASDAGELEILTKCRGQKKALKKVIEKMKELNWINRKVIIHHCNNIEGANELSKLILEQKSDCVIEIRKTGGLCRFYAEEGGLLIGFEKI